MTTKRLIRLTLLTIGVVAFTSGCAFTHDLFKSTPLDPAEAFDRTSSLIESHYIDKSGNAVKLDTSMRPDVMTLLAQLDGSAEYYDLEASESLMPSRKGATGVSFKLNDDSIEIESTMLKSPARKAGLRPGEKIIEIDDISVAGRKMSNVRSMLQGPVGSEVKIKVITPPDKERTVKVTREIVKPVRLVVNKLSDNTIGYLRIEDFQADTPDVVEEAVKRFSEENAKGLILDVRNNSGGLFTAITEVAQLFLKDGEVVCTLTARKENKKIYRAEGRGHYTDMPMAVLIDGKTASGAEILAASLGDNKRALLVGETSAGMVDIRTLFPLGGGSHLVIRTALASKPDGKRFDEHGIAPDREVILTEEERAGLYRHMETAIDGYLGNDANDRQVKGAVGILTGADRSR
jgi:carboxyl-terminal processing protease